MLNLAFRMTSLYHAAAPASVCCSDTCMAELFAGLQEAVSLWKGSRQCLDTGLRNVFADQTRPIPPREPLGNLRLDGPDRATGCSTSRRGFVVRALLSKQGIASELRGKGIFLKMSMPGAPCSGAPLRMGERYLWMRVGSRLHFSPSPKSVPVLGAV